MTVNLHIRDVPDDIHETLAQRAEGKGVSLRQYAIEVLAEHCSLPTLDEWLDEFAQMEPVKTSMSAAEAVETSRCEDDLTVLRAHAGS